MVVRGCPAIEPGLKEYYVFISKTLKKSASCSLKFEVQCGFDNLTFPTCEVYTDNNVLTWEGLIITLSNCLHSKILCFLLVFFCAAVES